MSNRAATLQLAAPFIAVAIAGGALWGVSKLTTKEEKTDLAAAAALKAKCEERDQASGLKIYHAECK